ncbi:hypothetical protein RDI58_015510 [Solanum bulbocastanum]|uniref:Alkyl transferase n=1 Tax=Solanum bulbocastanum TaxID=147425 RepID=A0AAN8YBH8_SOLBU
MFLPNLEYKISLLLFSLLKSGIVLRFGVRVSVIGGRSKLPIKLQKGIELTEEATKGNEGLHLTMELNYGEKYDMLQATKSIASKVKDGLINLEDINNKLFEQELATKCAKTPDLVIRTGGEQKLSNFLLWELVYSELYFTKTLFPDFGEEAFKEAILSFQQRQTFWWTHILKLLLYFLILLLHVC